MDISDFQPTSILYYKDRKQLKTFLTQIGPAVSLTPDPRVRTEGGGTEWRPIKITCWRAFLANKVIFFSPHLAIPTYHTRSLHIYCLPISGSSFCLVRLPSSSSC